MEILVSTYTAFTAAALVIVAVALLVAQLITSKERSLIASAAILFAGLFFAMRPGSSPSLVVIGAVVWLLGLLMFVHGVLGWRRAYASRAGPYAVIFLLPPAVLGAVIAIGALLSALVAPARLAMRLLGA